MGYRPWGHKESNTTEQLALTQGENKVSLVKVEDSVSRKVEYAHLHRLEPVNPGGFTHLPNLSLGQAVYFQLGVLEQDTLFVWRHTHQAEGQLPRPVASLEPSAMSAPGASGLIPLAS